MPKYSMQSMVATKSDMILILIYDRVLIRIEFYKKNVLLGKTHVELHLLCFQKLVLVYHEICINLMHKSCGTILFSRLHHASVEVVSLKNVKTVTSKEKSYALKYASHRRIK